MENHLSNAFLLAHEFTEEWEEVLQNGLNAKKGNRFDAYLGISEAWLEDAHEEIGYALNRPQRIQLMHRTFWKKLCCESLPLPLAVFLYDSVVHMGIMPSMHILQNCCNIVGEAHLDVFKGLKVNYINDAETIALACNLNECNLAFYTARMCVRQRVNFYKDYIRKMPNFHGIPHLNKHLILWKERCQALLEHLAILEREF